MNKPHPHAALIKAWADGAEIQFKMPDGQWRDIDRGREMIGWHPDTGYRIKPAEPEYPITKMSTMGIDIAMSQSAPRGYDMFAVANAALRHAIDAGQVVRAQEHKDLSDKLIEANRKIAEVRQHILNMPRPSLITDTIFAMLN